MWIYIRWLKSISRFLSSFYVRPRQQTRMHIILLCHFFFIRILISCMAAFIVFAKNHHAQCTHDQINASAYEMWALKTHDQNNKMMQLTLNKHVKQMILWSGVCVFLFPFCLITDGATTIPCRIHFIRHSVHLFSCGMFNS